VAGDEHEVVVVGGGAAGLAVAAALAREGVSALVLEAEPELGAAWRARYDRLHLHTPRRLSGLPGYPIPRRHGRWLPRDAVVEYLQDYAARQQLDVRLGSRAERIEPDAAKGWIVRTATNAFRARHVVLATGYSNVPHLPQWPGIEGYSEELLHSSRYANPEPFRARDVLVVGSGNSGAEIAADLAGGGAGRTRIAVRTPPHITKRAPLGIPAQLIGLALMRLPRNLGAAIQRTARRLTIPDLSDRGLPVPAESLGAQFARTGTIPILDVGFVDAVRDGRLEVVAAVAGFDGDDVLLADGSRIRPEVVIAATGFRPGLEQLVGHLGVLDPRGLPRDDEPAPGLHFIGYRVTLGGMLRMIGRASQPLARQIAAELAARRAA
jgi:putative flavoprotein involved in K+ transport